MVLAAKWRMPTRIALFICIFISLSEAIVQPWEDTDPCYELKTTVSEEDDCYIRGKPTICPNMSMVTDRIVKKCRSPYTSGGQGRAVYKCGDHGKWVPSFDLCLPDCGIGTSTNKYPWLAGIYDSEEKLVCSGTIISPYHVVTAAQCIRLDSIELDGTYKADPKEYTIIAGKHYSNIRRTRGSQQNRKVKNIIRHEDYRDWSTTKEQDIVLIEVDQEFEFFDDVRPACIDWQLFYEEWDLKDGNDGIVVSWGYEKDEVVPCEGSVVQYWQKNICWENLPKNFRKHFGIDKFCVRYFNDTCGKQIGTGLLFKSNRQRYFLRGITSTFNADTKSYVLYTKLSIYLEWLKEHMIENERISPVFDTFGKGQFNSSDGCILPQHLQYGKFSLASGNTYPENTWVPSPTAIILSCQDSSVAATSFRCLSSEWYPSIHQAVCKKPGACSSLGSSEAEDVYCKLNGSPISCQEPSANATAIVVCRPYYAFGGHSPVYKCQNGKWDPPHRPCNVECGTKRVDVTTLAVGGTEALKNEYPWVVAIYNKKDIQVCGGTLISRNYVLSAAHCFTSRKGVHKPKEDYTIIAGKYNRNISIDDPGSQRRKIKNLRVHEDYKGSLQKHRDDIALIELDEVLTVSFEVQPVCIDWESTFEDIDFTKGKMGVVAGWGFTTTAGPSSDVLKKINVPFQPKDVCIENLPEDFSYEFVATDKICAGYKDNNTNVCEGDSGGGLYFKSDGARYFIRGIVSLTVKSTVGCNTNTFALYTKVSKYLPWIEEITRKIV